MGMRVALSAKVRERQLGVMTSLSWPNGQTKHLNQMINARGLKKTLFITGEDSPCTGLERAIANIPRVKLVTAEELNVYEILKWHRVLLDRKAVDYFEQLLGKQTLV
jgi:large subunit ribosomal protein L4